MSKAITHRSLGFFPENENSLQLQAHRACREFFDKVDIDRLRKLAKNFLSTEWKKDFDHRNRELVKVIRAHGLQAVINCKLATEKEVLGYYANRLLGRPAVKPTFRPIVIKHERWVLRLGASAAVTAFSIPAFITITPAASTIKIESAIKSEVVATAPTLPKLTTRPEVGVYADPTYRHPHLRIAMGPAAPITVRFGSLAGESANSGWYARYIGIPMGKVPAEAVVDPLAQHARMFAVKFDSRASWEVQPVARTMDEQYAEMYNTQRTHMTLPQFVEGVRTVINETRRGIDWAALCADQRINLNPDQCILLRQVTGRITPEMLVTYGMTELFPREQSRTHDFNQRILEHGLINYGREFWDLTPAQSDGLASAGLWQLTSKAVGAYVDEDGVPRIGGATIVGRYVDNRPPESFLNFSRTDHEQAAYLFAVHNIALLIKESAKTPQALATMRRVWVNGDRQLELLQYIATAHHAPYGVYRYAVRWLNAGAKKQYQEHLRGRFVEYAKRTRLNWPSMAPRPIQPQGDAS